MGFAQTLDKLPKSLESFKLDYTREPPRNRYFQPPSIIPHNAPGDILSQAFYHFTQRDGLRYFDLEASIDSTILWPRLQLQRPDDKPHWPTLQCFQVELNDVLPSGQWMEIRDDEDAQSPSDSNDYESDDEIPGEEYERSFSSICDQAVINRFALAAGRSASHMPRIKEFYISYCGHTRMDIGFVTISPRLPCLEFYAESRAPEPSEETLNAWREAINVHGLEWNIHITDNIGHVYHVF